MQGLFKVLIGAAAGVVYGLFFAQKSGKQLRKDIGKAEDPSKPLVEALKGSFKDFSVTSKDWYETSPAVQKVKDKAAEGLDQAKAKLGEEASKLKDKATEAAEKAQSEAGDLAAAAKEKAGKFKNDIVNDLKKARGKDDV